MDPITISILVAATVFLAGAVVVFIAYLTYNFIVNWFRKRSAIKEEDKANIAFTIKETLDSGNYKLVQGIFNTSTEEIVDYQVIETEELDNDLDEIHSDNELALYN
jgi:hypothetical protein